MQRYVPPSARRPWIPSERGFSAAPKADQTPRKLTALCSHKTNASPQRAPFGTNIPSPTGSERKVYAGFESPAKDKALVESPSQAEYSTTTSPWARWAAPPLDTSPNFRAASHSHALSPLRGDHYRNNANLDVRGYD